MEIRCVCVCVCLYRMCSMLILDPIGWRWRKRDRVSLWICTVNSLCLNANGTYNERINDNNYEIDYTRSLTMEYTTHFIVVVCLSGFCTVNDWTCNQNKVEQRERDAAKRKYILLRWIIMCINCVAQRAKECDKERRKKQHISSIEFIEQSRTIITYYCYYWANRVFVCTALSFSNVKLIFQRSFIGSTPKYLQ